MKKLITGYEGGFPLTQDDLAFMDAAVREAFFGLLSAFGISKADSFRLSGCELSKDGTMWACSAGYISLEGEILPVLAHEIEVAAMQSAWFVVDTLESSDRIFKGGASHKVHQQRYGVLQAGTPTVGTEMMYNAPYLHEVIAAKTHHSTPDTNWRVVGSLGNPNFLNSWEQVPGTTVAFKRGAYNEVYLKGWVHVEAFADYSMFRLPPGYRPSESLMLPALYGQGGEPTHIIVDADGHVKTADPTVSNVYLDGITFIAL